MNMKSLRFFICFTFVFILTGNLNATHLLGGDISYSHQGGMTYKLTYRIIRSCKSLPLTTIDFGISNEDGSVNKPLVVSRTSIQDISLICKDDTLPCNPQNTSTTAGQELHIFETTVDLSNSVYDSIRSGCKVIFYTGSCCRNSSVTTLVPGNFYLNAMVDICVSGNAGNHSPRFGNSFISEICCAQPFAFNAGIIRSSEDDSISYELSTPLRGLNDPEVYNGDFSHEFPMTPYCPPNPGVINCRPLPGAKPPRGIYFDKENGDLIFTPVNCSETGVIVIRVNEWRRDSTGTMQLAGYTCREITLFVRSCSDNNPPYFAGNNKFQVCEGSKLCFTIGTKDDPFLPNQTIPDTTELTWDSAIADATFRIVDTAAREKSAEFCWQTKKGDAAVTFYQFTCRVNDGFCNPPIHVFRSYLIKVNPKSEAQVVYNYGFRGRLIFESMPGQLSWYDPANYRYQFMISDTAGNTLYSGMNKLDSFTFTQAGNYIIEHWINNPPFNCPTVFKDTMTITPFHLTSIPENNTARLQIFPNPGRGRFTIHVPDSDLRDARVSVFSSAGKAVHTAVIRNNAMDLKHLSPGVYTVRIETGGRVYLANLFIQ